MSSLEFEQFVADVLRKQGYRRIQLTERFDLGIDIRAERDGLRWGIQVKRYQGIVRAAAVRQAVTALPLYGCDRAMVISNSYYSKSALRLADANNCRLVDGQQLQRWIYPN